MCGRFFVDEDFESIYKRYDIHYEPELFVESPTIFPTQKSPVVIGSDHGNRIGMMQWGFTIPGVNRPIINGRTETIFEKVSFRQAIMKRRCLVPANAYFEWETLQNGKKVPFKITSMEESLMSLAGVFTAYHPEVQAIEGPDSTQAPEKIWQFSLLTKPALGVVSSIHDRMPVILDHKHEQFWLSPSLTPSDIKDLIALPYRGLILEKL